MYAAHSVSSSKLQLFGSRSTEIVLLLRTVNMLLVPIVASLFLLNDCGKWWTTYWTPCHDPATFDVDLELRTVSGSKVVKLLRSGAVCSPPRVGDIDWGKCSRSLFFSWTYVVMNKFVLMIAMPFALVLLKLAKQRLRRKFSQEKEEAPESIEVAAEYASIITSFESVLTFSTIAPLILPVVLLAIDANVLCYHIMLRRLGWKLTSVQGFG